MLLLPGLEVVSGMMQSELKTGWRLKVLSESIEIVVEFVRRREVLLDNSSMLNKIQSREYHNT